MKRIKIGDTFFNVQGEVNREQLEKLVKVRLTQCPERKVTYVTTEFRDGIMQTWMVMDGIELSYMMYNGKYASIFMCARYSSKYGEDVYYFKTYKKCLKIWEAQDDELNSYIKSITF